MALCRGMVPEWSDCVLTFSAIGGTIAFVDQLSNRYARVVELVDSLDSGSSVQSHVGVRLPPRAPNHDNPNPRPIGGGFGFIVWFD